MRGHRLVLLGLALLAVIGGDWFMRNREMDQLVEAVEQSEASMVGFNKEAARATSRFESVQYPASGDYAALARSVSDAARSAAVDLIDAHDQVADVGVLPWHGDLAKAKDRYLVHSAVWRDALEAAAVDASTWFEPKPAISGTFKIAERAFEEAIPSVPIFDLAARVEDVFDE